MDPTLSILCLWALFAATHMVLSSVALRPRLVRTLGDRGFLGVYSLIALATFVWLCVVYGGHRHEGALLYALAVPDVLRFALYALQAVAWTLVVASFATPSPAALGSEAPDAAAVAAVHRMTRHPALWRGGPLRRPAPALHGLCHRRGVLGGLSALRGAGLLASGPAARRCDRGRGLPRLVGRHAVLDSRRAPPRVRGRSRSGFRSPESRSVCAAWRYGHHCVRRVGHALPAGADGI